MFYVCLPLPQKITYLSQISKQEKPGYFYTFIFVVYSRIHSLILKYLLNFVIFYESFGFVRTLGGILISGEPSLFLQYFPGSIYAFKGVMFIADLRVNMYLNTYLLLYLLWSLFQTLGHLAPNHPNLH